MNGATDLPTKSASVSTAFRFADLAIRNADIGSESEVFLRTIRIVRNDLLEVERLVAVGSVRTKLAQTPARLPWIRSSIENTTSALEEIGRWVDCSYDGQYPNVLDQSYKLRHVLDDRERLADRKSELMACHQQLSNVLSFLNRMEDLPTSKELPTYQDTTYLDDIVSKHRPATSQVRLKGGSPKTAVGNKARTNPCYAFNTSRSVENDSLTPDAHYAPYTSTTDAVKSALQLLNGHIDTMSSRFTLDHKTYAGYPSPPSLPNSPPPTYTSVGQRSPYSQTSHEDTRSHVNTDRLRPGSSRLSMRAAHDDFYTTPLVEKDTWACRPPERHQALAELAGDCSMSGTNSDGPVNPYAFHPITSISAPRPTSFRDSKIETLSELLGDVSLAVELPGSEPAHTPRHSLRRSNDTSNYGPSASQTYSNGYPTSVSELPATPRRRPIMSHTVSEPAAIANESLLAPPTFELDLVPSRTHTFMDAQSQAGNSRPWSLLSVSSSPRLPTSSTVSLRTSTFDAPVTTELTLEHEQPVRSHTTQPAVKTSSARMRRQKHMLDLLDSIDR